MEKQYVVAIIVLLIGACIAIFKPNQSKGEYGEMLVKGYLRSLGPEYRVLNNITIYGKNGNSAQIDHVVVSRFGLFVIETKNYSGYIHGSDDAQNWTQIINKRAKKSFYNPIKQNQTHINALKNVTGLPDNCFESVVVFTDKAKLQVDTKAAVIYANQVSNYIKDLRFERFDEEQVDEIANKIIEAQNKDNIKEKDHIKQVKIKQQTVKNGECPICGSKLVKRAGKYGEFYGCSGYPKCRFKTTTL